jgi:hypothetical protein
MPGADEKPHLRRGNASATPASLPCLYRLSRHAANLPRTNRQLISFFARRCFQLLNLATQSDLDSKRVVNLLRAAAGGHEPTGCSAVELL